MRVEAEQLATAPHCLPLPSFSLQTRGRVVYTSIDRVDRPRNSDEMVKGSLARAGLLAAAANVLCAVDIHAQSTAGVCERTLGEADWPCKDIAPVPTDVRRSNSIWLCDSAVPTLLESS